MPLGPNLIVDRTSSIMLLENEVKRYGLNANHREMCRFRDRLDQNWLSVGSSIVELVSLTSTMRIRGMPAAWIAVSSYHIANWWECP